MGTYVASGSGTAQSDRNCVPCQPGTFANATNLPLCYVFSVCPAGGQGIGGSSTADWTCQGSSTPSPSPSTAGGGNPGLVAAVVILVLLGVTAVGGVWFYHQRKIASARVVLARDADTGEVEGFVSFSSPRAGTHGLSIRADRGGDTAFVPNESFDPSASLVRDFDEDGPGDFEA